MQAHHRTTRAQLTSITRCVGLASLLLAASACRAPSIDVDLDITPQLPPPQGPVAKDAEEAWPERPAAEIPVLSDDAIVRACVRAADCAEPSEGASRLDHLFFCASSVAFSAERAIPVSGLAGFNERAEFFVDCTLNAADCTAVNACATRRHEAILCEEDGCRLTGGAKLEVTCNGDVATLSDGTTTVERDCSRAFATCSPTSETGCTDRHYTLCPPELDLGDRCEGDIRLGCDGAGQVSYRDCSRMGGRCEGPDGSAKCVYDDSVAQECADGEPELERCTNAEFSTCMSGQRITMTAPAICSELQ